MRPIDADALENNLIEQLDKANHTEQNVGIAMAINTVKSSPTVHEGGFLMKFVDLCKLVPEQQQMHLIYSELEVFGTADALSCMVNKEVDECKVINLEAENDTVKVWVTNENA